MLTYLNQILPSQINLYGAKAVNLSILLLAGFRVPSAVVLSTKALRCFLDHNNLYELAVRGAEQLPDKIKQGVFPAQLAAEIFTHIDSFGPLWIARSSATDEDSKTNSFAGQYESFSNLSTKEQVLHGIKSCWASYYSENVSRYRTEHTVSLVGMGVIVQEQVQPIQSGVLFTINPLNGSWREMVVESYPGLGEHVVGAKVIPDFYLVRRPRITKWPFSVLTTKIRLHLIEAQNNTKNPISNPEVLSLSKRCLEIERTFSEPQDIEWVQDKNGTVWFVQTRPITSTVSRFDPQQTIWTRQFLGERWGCPATRLGWSEMSELIAHFIDYPLTNRKYLGGEPPVRLYRNSPYINASIFRQLLFKFPGAEPVPRFMLELIPPVEREMWKKKYAGAPNWKVYFSVLLETYTDKRWRRFRWNPFSNWLVWDRYIDRLNAFLQTHSAEVTNLLQAKQRLALCAVMAKDYAKIHVCSLLFADLWYQLTQWRLQEANKDHLLKKVLRSNRITATQKVNQALWKLGQNQISLDSFLLEYGHRGENTWALFSPRWKEDPSHVLALSRMMIGNEDPTHKDAMAISELRQAMNGLDGSLAKLVYRTQKYLFLREEQRFHFDRLLWVWKQTWLFVEDHLQLPIRHLSKSEVFQLIDGNLSEPLALIEAGKKDFEQQEQQWICGDFPPQFIIGESMKYSNSQADHLYGVGVSAGVVQGPARLVFHAKDAEKLLSGEILVVSTIDPGLTSLFLRAKGVVMALGGMLSHGAVIAREYKVPTVAGVGEAISKISNGQIITVDGGRGMVWL